MSDGKLNNLSDLAHGFSTTSDEHSIYRRHRSKRRYRRHGDLSTASVDPHVFPLEQCLIPCPLTHALRLCAQNLRLHLSCVYEARCRT